MASEYYPNQYCFTSYSLIVLLFFLIYLWLIYAFTHKLENLIYFQKAQVICSSWGVQVNVIKDNSSSLKESAYVLVS
jgi:hypothetical protein